MFAEPGSTVVCFCFSVIVSDLVKGCVRGCHLWWLGSRETWQVLAPNCTGLKVVPS